MKSEGLSGKQIAVLNLKRFEAWVAERDRAGDWRSYVRGNRLNRTDIALDCGFAKSVLRQNPSVGLLLASIEERLAKDGVLSPLSASDDAHEKLRRPSQSEGDARAAQVTLARAMAAKTAAERRAKGLEEQNAALRAEVRELRASLNQHRLMEEHLALTGRLLVR